MWKWRYKAFNFPRTQKIRLLDRWVLPTISYYSAKFRDQKCYGSFWFVMWLRHQKVRGLSKYGPLNLSYHPAKLGDHRCCGSVDRALFICNVTAWSKIHEMWCLGSPQHKLPPCQIFCRSYGKEDVIFPIPSSVFTNGQLKKSFYAVKKNQDYRDWD